MVGSRSSLFGARRLATVRGGMRLLGALAVGLVIGAGSLAVASGDATPVYTACVNNSSGTIKMIAADGVCANNEIRITWNQRGPAGLTWRGAWDAAVAYAPGDVVSSGGGSWVAVSASSGERPGSAASWQLLAAKGDTGDTGPIGPAGPQGERGDQGAQGVAGPAGPAGAGGLDGLSCWDLDADRVADEAEDLNADGVTDALDCRGPQGPAGDADVSALEARIAALESTIADLVDMPTLSIADAEIVEGNSGQSSLVFEVTLSRATSLTVTVDYATSNGTANAGSDYVATSGTLFIPAGQSSATISVPVVGDAAPEVHEAFTVALSKAANAMLGDAQATGTIRNDDVPTMGINDAACREETACVFTVRLNGPTGERVEVSFQTEDRSAHAGTHYSATSGTLVFQPGETQRSIVVNTKPVLSGELTFVVTLSNPLNAVLVDGEGRGVIFGW